MARQYMILETMAGARLQITGGDEPDEAIPLVAVSDEGRLEQAEELINERHYRMQPFPGFHWVEMNHGWITTEYDLREEQ